MFVDKKSLPLWKRLVVRIVGAAFAYEKNHMHYYLCYYRKHGYYIDHERGYKELISCPECNKESDKLARVIRR